jgi:hypothetical protein
MTCRDELATPHGAYPKARDQGQSIAGRGRASQRERAAQVSSGSLANVAGGKIHVRFASDSGHQGGRDRCPLSANKGRTALQQISALFDDLVGECEKRFRNLNADCLGGRDVDDKLKFGRLLDRNIAGLRAAQNLVHDLGSAPEL